MKGKNSADRRRHQTRDAPQANTRYRKRGLKKKRKKKVEEARESWIFIV